ncbi:MAG: ribonuclease, partial [Anaerolineales bacterium]|nr:ribonuclease [Anaerolineales bacterium]
YNKDGSTFQNREGLLPSQPRGYYREYTVETPGSRDRGARRIVAGEGGEFYYTADHYASFARIWDP